MPGPCSLSRSPRDATRPPSLTGHHCRGREGMRDHTGRQKVPCAAQPRRAPVGSKPARRGQPGRLDAKHQRTYRRLRLGRASVGYASSTMDLQQRMADVAQPVASVRPGMHDTFRGRPAPRPGLLSEEEGSYVFELSIMAAFAKANRRPHHSSSPRIRVSRLLKM